MKQLIILTTILLTIHVTQSFANEISPSVDGDAWSSAEKFQAECRQAIKASEGDFSAFDDSSCNAFIQGYFAGYAHGGYNSLSVVIEKFPTYESQTELSRVIKEKYPICFPDDYDRIRADFSNRDMAISYLQLIEKDENIKGQPNAAESLFAFLVTARDCEHFMIGD